MELARAVRLAGDSRSANVGEATTKTRWNAAQSSLRPIGGFSDVRKSNRLELRIGLPRHDLLLDLVGGRLGNVLVE